MSDLNGTDIFVHGGTVEGVLRGLSDCFVHVNGPPPMTETKRIYRELRRAQPGVLKRVGATTIFSPRAFKELALMARVLTTRLGR